RPTLAITRFGTVRFAGKFTLDAVGIGESSGKTVRWPPALGRVTVTFNTTAPVSVSGTPPRPDTSTSIWSPLNVAAPIGPTLALARSIRKKGHWVAWDGPATALPLPRVSANRAGLSAT